MLDCSDSNCRQQEVIAGPRHSLVRVLQTRMHQALAAQAQSSCQGCHRVCLFQQRAAAMLRVCLFQQRAAACCPPPLRAAAAAVAACAAHHGMWHSFPSARHAWRPAVWHLIHAKSCRQQQRGRAVYARGRLRRPQHRWSRVRLRPCRPGMKECCGRCAHSVMLLVRAS